MRSQSNIIYLFLESYRRTYSRIGDKTIACALIQRGATHSELGESAEEFQDYKKALMLVHKPTIRPHRSRERKHKYAI